MISSGVVAAATWLGFGLGLGLGLGLGRAAHVGAQRLCMERGWEYTRCTLAELRGACFELGEAEP